MKKAKRDRDKERTKPPFNFYYSEELQRNVFEVLDGDSLYPCCWKDPNAGIREIRKTKNNGLQMC
jgi:hypothetical protein